MKTLSEDVSENVVRKRCQKMTTLSLLKTQLSNLLQSQLDATSRTQWPEERNEQPRIGFVCKETADLDTLIKVTLR